ncbi:hypothetical protein TSUD_92270 [Trifolium subterraneum]|uniref:Uncharacterized protein n=1 Tax=Trifolium subterraneum TaxID=3900 RepID=A0A2Z6NXG7_TRISU|nr:hypothetical protein TSUD_92270 [Trifolium subterraneum]
MAAHTNNTYVCTTNTTGVCQNDPSCLFGATQIANNTKRGHQESNTFNVTNCFCSSTDDLCKDLGNNISSLIREDNWIEHPNARDRCHFINSVLKPIENLVQWNLVKEAKRDDTMLAGRNVKKVNARDRKHYC